MSPGMAIERTVPRISDAAWNRWLMNLQPWELHLLTRSGRELDWHDDYIRGIVSLDELTAVLYAHFAPELKQGV